MKFGMRIIKATRSMETTMAKNEHKHRSMDISEQEKTFDGFMKWSMRVGAASLAVVIFLALFAR